MTLSFTTTIDADGIEIQAVKKRIVGQKVIPFGDWVSSGVANTAVAFLNRLMSEGNVKLLQDQSTLVVPHRVAASMPTNVADAVGLPPLTPASCTLTSSGRVDQEATQILVNWRSTDHRQLMPNRQGAFLSHDGANWRLSQPVFQLLEEIDLFNATVGADPENRINAWGPVQDGLTHITGNQVDIDRHLKELTIYQAASFALDVKETASGPNFLPVLMARSMRQVEWDETEAPEDGAEAEDNSALRDAESDRLLHIPGHQQKFASRFEADQSAYPAYVLDRNKFVVLDPGLVTALNVVKAKNHAPEHERREFIRNPRPFLVEAMDDDTSASLFVETKQYSDRVDKLDLWNPPQLPWLSKFRTEWLPADYPLSVDGEEIKIVDPPETVARKIEEAEEAGQTTVHINGRDIKITDLKRAIQEKFPEDKTGDEPTTTTDPRPTDDDAPDHRVLTIRDNLEDVDFIRRLQERPGGSGDDFTVGGMVRTSPKSHQIQGFEWLVDGWRKGWPGVLLADDMGLGKTLQALAFIAWVRKNQTHVGIDRPRLKGPILVVAPTALLRTWVAEAEKHLEPDALGDRVEAFDGGLKALKTKRHHGWTPEDALELDTLRDAGWILTTYETLKTYHRAFARVHYAVAIFDEMQKIKSPSTLNTNAAKSISADFVLGLTGTPVENRLEDLWCVMDRVADGYLGSLKAFNERYSDATHEQLRDLKSKLETGVENAPPILKRRMKQEVLDGLPERRDDDIREEAMPAAQAQAYADAVLATKGMSGSQKTILEAIQRLRRISLHPALDTPLQRGDEAGFKEWSSQSARVATTLKILEDIRSSDEKALIFSDFIAAQEAMAIGLTMYFDLPKEPTIINGGVAGPKRQALVDEFQNGPEGFDVMILSPKAAGVGLTITEANHVIHLSRWWNPAVEDQCNDRIYRIGQTKPVTVHIPMAIHQNYQVRSFDRKLHDLMERKRELSRNLLAPPVTDNDVGELFDEVASKA
jgi:SNF2 family DNA or RNA helicase